MKVLSTNNYSLNTIRNEISNNKTYSNKLQVPFDTVSFKSTKASLLYDLVKRCPDNQRLLQDLNTYIKQGHTKITEADIKGIIGYGGLSLIFDIGKDKVLKCTKENPLEHRKHQPAFDIPFLSPIEKFGEHYFVVEPKADTKNVTREDCIDVINRIYNAGFEPSSDLDEYKIHQIGRYNGKPYLLDTRAAMRQPDEFSKFIYDFCNNARRVYFANKIEYYDFKIEHIDETPRKNLKFCEGIKMALDVINTNKKYAQSSKFESFGLKYYLILEAFIQKIKDKFSK